MPRKKKTSLLPMNNATAYLNKWSKEMYSYEPGDNSKNINFLLAINQLPKVDLYNPAEVQQRTIDYFSLCESADMKPLVTGYAGALGLDRRRLLELRTGNYHYSAFNDVPKETIDIIRHAYDMLEQLWETNMLQGKINPVTGIFLSKNYWGYKDNVDYTISPGQTDNNADDIMKRYEQELIEEKK